MIPRYRSVIGSSLNRPASSPSKSPTDTAVSNQTSDRFTDLSLQYRPPRHQREFSRFFDQSEAPASQVDPSSEYTVDPITLPRFLERLAKLIRDTFRDRQQLALL